MKKQFFLFLFLSAVVLFAMPPNTSLEKMRNGYQIQLTIPEINLTDHLVQERLKDGTLINETFVKASIPGFSGKGAFGNPELLTSSIQLALEDDIIIVEVSNIIQQKITLQHKIYPVQPVVYDGSGLEYFSYNPKAYTRRGPVHSSYVRLSDTYTYRGQNAASIEFNPIQYDPQKNTLTVAKSFTVSFKMKRPTLVKSLGSPSFDKQMRSMFKNLRGDLGRGIPSEPFSGREKYLIIASSTYADNSDLEKFVEFRSSTFDVELVTTSDVGSSKDDYRDYIREMMPAFCLLVGKYSDFPTHSYNSTRSYAYYTAPTTSAPKPDIALGLFFAREASSLTNIVNKTISVEENLADYPNHFLAFGGNTQSMGNLPPNHCDVIIREMYDDYLSPMGEWDITECYQVNSPKGGKTEAIAALNEGVRFINYNGHGVSTGWTYGSGSWTTSSVGSVSNTIYPFVLSCACQTGNFVNNSGSWAETWIGDENLGAAFIGANTTSYTSMHGFNRGIFRAIAEEEMTKYGLAYINAIAYTYDTVSSAELVAWQFHYFGDPAIETISIPSFLTLTSPVGGEVWERGQSVDISWNSNISDDVKIEIYNDGSLKEVLAASVSSPGPYTWDIPADFEESKKYKIKITSVDQSTLFDESSDFFTIEGPTSISGNGMKLPISLDLTPKKSLIYYQIPQDYAQKQVRISLYGIQGKQVRTLVNGPVAAGYHTVRLDRQSTLSAGLYLCRMTAEGFTKTVSVLLKK